MYDQCVCLLECVCVCVICYHVNQKKGVMEYVIELSGVDPLLKRVELKSAIIKWRTEQQIKRKWIIMTEIRSQAKENKEKDDF